MHEWVFKMQLWGMSFVKPFIVKEGDKPKGVFGLTTAGGGMLAIYGDEAQALAYLGPNAKENDEMSLQLESKSKNDPRAISMMIDEDGERFDCWNKMGEDVTRLAVSAEGGDILDVRDKHGYK